MMFAVRHLVTGAALVLVTAVSLQASQVVVKQPDVCFQCHVDMAETGKLKHVHTAFAAGECSDCHNPHASIHASLLEDDARVLCLSCHEDVKTDLNKMSQHAPVVSGSCLDCHDPHASEFEFQLKRGGAALCAGCHTNIKAWQDEPIVHAPFGAGECTTCHTPHGSDNVKLLSNSPPALCLDCHDVDQTFRAKHGRPGIEKSNCTTCHDPHASPVAGLLRANQHAPFEAGQCESCHISGGSEEPFAIAADVKDLCQGCHGEMGGKNLKYHHNLDDSRSCLNCHNPHASNVSELLRAKQQDLCLGCHFNGPELTKPKSEYITHNGQACTTCHLPHGADNDKYLKSVGVDLCTGCHEGAHRSSHPVGDDTIDPRTGKQLTCISCHQLHGADFEKYLPLDPTMDLCIQCHKK